MKKVLMIGMNADVGGIETYIMNVYRHLNRDEYSLYFPYVENIAYKEEIEELGGTFIYNLPMSRKNPIEYYKRWNQIFKEEKFDIVYFNNCDIVNIDILKIAKKQKVPVRIFHAHNSSNTLDTAGIHKLEEKHNRKISENVITNMLACSKNAGDYIFEKDEFQIISNGIDTSKYVFREEIRSKKREELGLNDRQKVILFVGRFTDIKNPLFAINVIKECHKTDPEFVGILCGAGDLEIEARKKIEKENMQDFVKLLGNRADINEIYSAADFLIMPSLFEGFPFVLVEAECNGLKCICSDNVEQNTNLIGTAEYYPLEDGSKAWAEKITAIELDNSLRPTYRQVIIDKGFDIVKTAQQVKAILEGNK